MSRILHVDPALLNALRANGLDSVDGAFTHAGSFNMTPHWLGYRQRFALRLDDDNGQKMTLFMKRYRREPLRQRLRRMIDQPGTTSPAAAEMAAIHTVAGLGIATMRVAVCGEQDRPRRSYIIVTQVPGEALEQCGGEFIRRCMKDGRLLQEFNNRLADLAARLHRAGLFHRDLYASHIYLDANGPAGIELYLIDLARLFKPKCRRRHWQVKDLAQLRYSMPPEWVDGCWREFLEIYVRSVPCPGVDRLERDTRRKCGWIARHDRALRRKRKQEPLP